MMELLGIREIAVLIAAAIAAYTDWKTGFIYDWITYPLIGLGVGLNLWEGQYLGLLMGAAVFGIGYILYYAGKLGGGDVKLFAGIALMVPFSGGQPFILNVLLLAAATSVVFLSVYYVTRYARKGIDWEYNKRNISRAALLGAALVIYFLVLLQWRGTAILEWLPLLIPLALGVVFVALEAGIRKEFFARKIKVTELEEDEVIIVEQLSPELRKELNLSVKKVIGNREKELLGKHLQEVWVYRNLPRFGPFIFLGVVLALLYPELLLGLFMA